MKTLKTKRLKLRTPKMRDAYDIFEYAKTNKVGPLAGWLPHKDLDETKDILKSFIKSEQVWVIEHNNDKKVIGTISLSTRNLDDLFEDIYELGYALNDKYWNQGLTSEAVRVVIDYTFKKLKVKKLICAHDVSNIASKKIIEKFNFSLVKIDNNPKYESDIITKVFIYELKNPYRGDRK